MLRMLLPWTLWMLWSAGCAHSEYPIHEPKEAIAEPAFVGAWTTSSEKPLGKGRYRITGGADGQYQLTADGEDATGKPADHAKDDQSTVTFCQCGPHFFVSAESHAVKLKKKLYVTGRLSILGDAAYVRPIAGLALEQILAAKPKALPHRFEVETGAGGSQSETLVVTAPIGEYQAYVLANLDTRMFWMVPQVYERTGGIPITKSGICSQKHRTFNYWWEARRTFQEWRTGVQPRTAIALQALTTNVRKFPTSGVDPEAVECVKELCGAIDDAAARLTTEARLSSALHGFLRGLSGKSPSGSFEELAASDQVVGRLKEIAERCRKSRAVLTSRYELEFPVFE